jgi:HlyD family secretion protein
MPMPWRRNLGLILLAVILLAAIAYGFWPQPVAVDVMAVTRAPLQVTVEEEGKTRVVDRFVISAPVPGYVRRIELKVGDTVGQGQILAEVEPLRSVILDPRSRAEAQARVAAAEAALRAAQEDAIAAEAEADYAASQLQRLRRLYPKGYISIETLQQAEAAARRTKARRSSSRFAVQVAKFDLEAARTALRYSVAQDSHQTMEEAPVRAPVEGRVLKLKHESEGVVQAGEPLLEIGDPNSLEIEVEVLSADAVRISPGTRVLFERWGGVRPLEGRVRRVEPTGFTKVSALGVEEQRVLVIADITSPTEQWQRLGDGYRVEASFILWEGDSVLQVPESALFRHRDGWAVFMAANGRARLQPVQVGHRSGLAAEIISPLKEGELVILHPDDSLADGARISLRRILRAS